MPAYDAFISYSHSKDKPIAASLQSVIQKIGKRWYERRTARVFRDDTSLSATPQLWPSIERALAESAHLILLASPEAAASPWIAKEVQYWLDHKSTETLLIGQTAGDLSWNDERGDFEWSSETPLPKVLKSRFVGEPKWVDLRAYREGGDSRDAKFIDLSADFASAIRGLPKEDLMSEEVRQQRRARRLAVGAAASLLVLTIAALGAAGLAAWQWRVAGLQRDRAEHTLSLATNTANDLIFELAQKFKGLSGVPAPVVKDLLDRARKLQDQLLSAGEGNSLLRRSQGAALLATARIFLELGETQNALASAEQAQSIFKNLVLAEPEVLQWQRDYASSIRIVGDVMLEKGNLASADSHYRESVTLVERLVETNPGNKELKRDMMESYEGLANCQTAQGNLPEALKTFNLGMEIATERATAGTPEAQRNLSIFHAHVAKVLFAQEDLEAASQHFLDSVAIDERLASGNPENLERQRDLAVSLDNVGDVLIHQSNFPGALRYFRRGLAIRERVAATDLTNAFWQRDIVASLNRISNILLAQNDLELSLQSARDSLERVKALVKKDPNNAGWQRDLAFGHQTVASVLVEQTNLKEALEHYRAALDIHRRLSSNDLSNNEWRGNIAAALSAIGDVLWADGSKAEALASFREALSVLESLIQRDPTNRLRQRQAETLRARIAGAEAQDVSLKNP